MKYFNVIFWVVLFGIIFYFAIDRWDIKRGIKNFNKDIIAPVKKIGEKVNDIVPEKIFTERESKDDEQQNSYGLVKKAKEKKREVIFENWYNAMKDSKGFENQLNKALSDKKLKDTLCKDMIDNSQNKKEKFKYIEEYKYLFKVSSEKAYEEICGINSKNFFENKIRELIS